MITDYGSDALIELVSYSGACDYLALLTAIPYGSIDGTALYEFEPTWADYVRQPIDSWSTSTGGLVYNETGIEYLVPADAEDYDGVDDQVVGWALCDSASDGNVYIMGEFVEPIAVLAETSILILPGMISVGISTTQAGDDD